jgi:hypothetical protein
MVSRIFKALLVAIVLVVPATEALALPVLQLYIEGADYDEGSETWSFESNGTFKLWVIGDVGHVGSILDVKLAAAASTEEILAGGLVTLTPTTAAGITDPSASSTPVLTGNSPSPDGAIPQLGDGSSLPSHGTYGPGTSFFEWGLGDFTLVDSPIGDFMSSYPTTFPDWGQISAYEVTVSGLSSVHFDAYDHVVGGSIKAKKVHDKYVFAPFSHDAEGDIEEELDVPEPGAVLFLGAGLVLLALARRQLR